MKPSWRTSGQNWTIIRDPDLVVMVTMETSLVVLEVQTQTGTARIVDDWTMVNIHPAKIRNMTRMQRKRTMKVERRMRGREEMMVQLKTDTTRMMRRGPLGSLSLHM